MKRVLKWVVVIAGVLVALLVGVVAAVMAASEQRLNQTYTVAADRITISTDEASIAEGQRLTTVFSCIDCHGPDFSGGIVIDDPMIGRLAAPNLTPGGSGATFTDEDWVRAIRYGVGSDGKSLMVMPSNEFYQISDDDLGEMIAYLKSLPPVEDTVDRSKSVGLLMRALFLAGQVPLLPVDRIDLDAPHPEAPEPSVTVEYGQYFGAMCVGCHGPNLSGGAIPGLPPDPPFPANLTPDEATGLGTWTEADFMRALREGKRPDGSEIALKMPWMNFRHMTDEEVSALWLYLQSVPARPEGNR